MESKQDDPLQERLRRWDSESEPGNGGELLQ